MLLMLGVGLLFNGDKPVFKSSITPIDKIQTDKKVVAIACNVYEGEDLLPSMLETLKKHDTKISFFIGGVWGKKNIEMIKQMKDSGHDIQNHGYYHKKPTQLSLEDNIKEINLTHDLLKSELGIETTIFEPPYGDFDEYTQKIVNQANHKLVTFNIDTIDWRDDASTDIILKRVNKKLNPGGIILMHPKEITEKSLDSIISYIKSQGYEIITVNEILNITE
ncbi:polysaccharide deacetylase family protein [Clostridium cylindrosporum]|nr:polysaccharide deacetylase family protein [Clostridium cylindrosporum]